MDNYYDILCINKNNFSKEQLEERYRGLKEIAKNRKLRHKDIEAKLKLLDEHIAKIDEAYAVLSDDEKRKEYDKLLEEQKRKPKEYRQSKESNESNGEPSKEKYECFDMYDSTLIKNEKYRKNTAREIYFMPYEFTEGKKARKVECKLIGLLAYSTDSKVSRGMLGRYEVKSISSTNPKTLKYRVLTPLINHDRMCADSKYKKAIYEDLFSEENLEKSRHENYEYLGRIITNRDNEYELDYDKEEFCAAVRFGIKLKRKVDNPSKPKKNIKKRFKRFIQKIKEKFINDDYER